MKAMLQTYEQRAYKTYKARLFASKRLHARAIGWNCALISVATATSISAIAVVAYPELYGPAGNFLFASLGVVSLVVSLVVASVNYQGRTRDMSSSYRRAQKLSIEFERLAHDSKIDRRKFAELSDQYQTLLDESENHEEIDYLRAERSMSFAKGSQDEDNATGEKYNKEASMQVRRRRWWLALLSNTLTVLPYAALIVPVGVTIPIVLWFVRASGQ